jgi:ketosteroid isomerase-like protein
MTAIATPAATPAAIPAPMANAVPPAGANAAAEVVRNFYHAFIAGDFATIDRLLADDAVFHVPGTGANAGTHRGKAAVFAFFTQAAELTGGSLKLQLHDVLTGDRHVAAVCTYRASRPGRAELENRLVQLIRLEGGRIAESWFHSRNQYEVDAFWH